jgi:hypothetical protein
MIQMQNLTVIHGGWGGVEDIIKVCTNEPKTPIGAGLN